MPFSSAPGKVYLFGEHAVVYGEPAVPCAIDKRITVSCTESDDNLISIQAPQIDINNFSIEFSESSSAIIDGEPVRIGSFFQGFQVIEITKNQVVLYGNRENLVLSLGKGSSTTSSDANYLFMEGFNEAFRVARIKGLNSFEYKADKIIIDKYPLNLIELGFIKTIFPKSKIVLAIRHPLDCIISCVMTSFKMNEAMVNFEDEKTTAHFYNECFDLLFKYFKFYKIDYLEVKYEKVISNFKNEINDLLKYLNLDFEESINSFHKTAMLREQINTPSYDQVTQPIYTSSINRYKNFNEIKNIKDRVNYWIKTFSY